METDVRYSKQQILDGFALLQQWYEGHQVEDIDGDQFFECVEKAQIRNSA